MKTWLKRGAILLVIILVIYVIYLAFNHFTGAESGKTSGWKAIYLNNGQVYFGHVNKGLGSFVTISDVYYLPIQKQADLMPGREISDQGTQIVLTKLGSALPNPTNQLRINRNSVVMIEDLRNDSKIVDAIKKMK